MVALKFSAKSLLPALALSGCLLAGLPLASRAGGGNPGLTIFSGVDRENILGYHLDFGGKPRNWDRYKLYIPAKKMTQGARKFFISYPEHYDGQFDTDSIQVRSQGESLPLREVYWDKESRVLEIDLEQPIEAGNGVDIVLSNVKNPTFGTYYFVGDALASGDIPVRLYLGTWIISIEYNN